jgi:hypothetical protein
MSAGRQLNSRRASGETTTHLQLLKGHVLGQHMLVKVIEDDAWLHREEIVQFVDELMVAEVEHLEWRDT